MMKNLLTTLLLCFGLNMLIAQSQSRSVPIDLDEGTNARDQVIADDLIVIGSECVGVDCSNGINFGFSTLILKENNLRLKFEDTSNSASFPTTDWTLEANASTNGGSNHFAILDDTNGKRPFQIEANAPNYSLFVKSSGNVGIGTDAPVVELHVKDGDSPTLRLEQDGSSGFTPQTWDVAGNEANFFVRDVTNGSKLSFKIKPGAPDNSLFVAADGDVGMGTASPQSALHVDNGNSETRLILEFDDQSAGSGGYAESVFRESGADKWSFGAASTTDGGRFYIFDYSNTRQVLTIDTDGDVGLGTSSNPQADLDINSGGMFSRINAGDATITTSSRRFKTNINRLEVEDILDKIANVPVTTYDWKAEYLREGEEPRLHNIGLIAEDFHTIFANGPETQISTREVQMALWLAAQKLHENDNEFEEQLQEKEQRIAELESQVIELTTRLDEITEMLQGNQETLLLGAQDRATLGQNYPNPSNGETVVDYYIPESTKTAEFQVSDLSGKVLKKININSFGIGKVNLISNDLPQGSYQYSLILDGAIVSTKKMIISR